MKNEEFSKEEVNWAEIDAKIQIIEENLTDLISKNNNFGDINGKLPLEDAIHLDIGLAYTINSIYYCTTINILESICLLFLSHAQIERERDQGIPSYKRN